MEFELRRPPLGFPVPDVDHAISVQLPTWQDMCDFAKGVHRVKDVQQTGYPRSFIHQHIVQVIRHCCETFGSSDQSCLPFPSLQAAIACQAYLQGHADDGFSYMNGNGNSINGLNGIKISKIHGFHDFYDHHGVEIYSVSFEVEDARFFNDIHGTGHRVLLSIVTFPNYLQPKASVFWRLTGLGISSRLAEQLLKKLHKAQKVTSNPPLSFPLDHSGAWALDQIQGRIAGLLCRSLSQSQPQVNSMDVYIYQTGMAAIYHTQELLTRWRPESQSVVFGFPYELTLTLVEKFGHSTKFFGFGTKEELAELESFVDTVYQQNRTIQAVWCEIPSNPLLRTVDLREIKRLGDRYGFPLIVDDTIGTFLNVCILDVADIIVTSLTKAFSGFANVMGGSVVLNPRSKFYGDFRGFMEASYHNEVYSQDLAQLEVNSRSFVARSTRMNMTAKILVDYLQSDVNPHPEQSPLRWVYYPTTCWSASNYRSMMRSPMNDFIPGYGCLFTLEFHSLCAAATFFNALDVHKGPSLGANVTLAQPYVQTVFHKQKEWAAKYSLSETIVRISVGLEDPAYLIRVFSTAIQAAKNLQT